MPEDVALMADILTVKARDLDSGQNARISYRLSKENSDFGIHAASGNVFVKSLLDRETIAEYRLLVIAADHGRVLPFLQLCFFEITFFSCFYFFTV